MAKQEPQEVRLTQLPHEGRYCLREPITNPHPDRRSKDWQLQPIIQPGNFRLTRFEERMKNVAGVEVLTYQITVRPISQQGAGIRKGSSVSFGLRENLTTYSRRGGLPMLFCRALADGALARDETFEDYLRDELDFSAYGPDVLLHLISIGAVSEAVVRCSVEHVINAGKGED